MILEINQDDSQRQRSSSLSNIKEEQSHINSENIFAFDVKYTKMFEKKKEESDDDFFQTFENLKLEKETKKNSVIVEENLSIKEDSSINKDIINLLNSPKQQTINLKKNSSFHSNNSIDENRDSLIKNLAKKSDDFEIKLHSLVDSETKSSVIQNSNQTIFDSIHEDYNINHSFDGKIHLLNNKNYIPRANDQYNNLRHTANSNKNLTPNEVTYNSYHNNINQCNNVPFINNKYPENYYPNTLPSNTILNVTNVYQYNNISLCPKSGLSPIKSIYDNYKMYGDMMNNYVQDEKINYNIVEHSDINNRLLKSTKLIQTPIEDMENYTDEEIEKYAYQLSKEQLGCRFLQKKLDQYIKLGGKIYEKLKDNIIELINDSFGNYLIQKLLEKINIEILEEVLYKIAPHFLSLGLDSHGTRVLQKLLEVIFHNTRLLDLYINIFSPYILLTFIKDINGNHIIQKLVSNLKFPKNSFIYSIVKENLLEIGIHKHGCCALQKCIEAANSVQKEELINLIIQHTQYLIVDQYGNYVVQYIIMMNNHSVNRKIVEMFLKLDFIYIAKQKYSSNVIEKCFDSSDKATKSLIVKQVAQKEIIKNLLFDSYGNYVLQKALSVAEETYYKYIISIIAPKLDKLRLYHSFGNKLYLKLLSKYPELYTTVNNPSKIKNSIPGIKKKNSNFPKKY